MSLGALEIAYGPLPFGIDRSVPSDMVMAVWSSRWLDSRSQRWSASSERVPGASLRVIAHNVYYVNFEMCLRVGAPLLAQGRFAAVTSAARSRPSRESRGKISELGESTGP